MVEVGEELLLVHDGMHRALGDDSGLEHFLHGVQLVGFFLLDFPYFAEATAADDVVEREVVLANF